MKKGNRRFWSVLICTCLIISLLAGTGTLSIFASTFNSWIQGDEDTTQLKTETTAELGTEKNPFLILEIVPSHDAAVIGYYIPGCEPINMNWAGSHDDVAAVIAKQFISAANPVFTPTQMTQTCFYEQIPEKSKVYVTDETLKGYRTEELSFMSEEQNYGQWNQKKNTAYSEEGYYLKTAEGVKGDFTWNAETNDVTYTPGEGNCNWNQSALSNKDDDVEKLWTTRKDQYCFTYENLQYENQDTLIQSIYQQNSASFTTKVVTVTPDELNNKLNLINEADLIYIHDGNVNAELTKVNHYFELVADESNENDPTSLAGVNATSTTFQDKDFTNQEVMKLMERMGSSHPAALVMDSGALLGDNLELSSFTSNAQKLYLISLQFTAAEFLDLFQSKIGTSGDTLTYNRESIWDVNTFRTLNSSDLTGRMHYSSIKGTGYNLVDTIFTYPHDGTMTDSLLASGQIKKMTLTSADQSISNVTSEAFHYYEEEEGKKDTLTYLEAIKYTLRQTYRTSIRILEIQPCDDFIYGDTGWEETYQELFPWFQPESTKASWLDDSSIVQVDTMTMWEFIGSTGLYDYDSDKVLKSSSSDDLTAKYDLIIFGSNQDESNGKNGYNDTTMGNLIYTSIGDLAVTDDYVRSGETSAINQSQSRYSGNDLTLKKMLELKDYLKAGHPIIVDKGLYTTSLTVDKKKVDESSKFYQLLTWQDDSECHGNQNLFISSQINPTELKRTLSREQCEIQFYKNGYPKEYDYTEGTNGVILEEDYMDSNEDGTTTLSYHFQIEGSASLNYYAEVNIDANGDGVYGGSLLKHCEVDNMNQALGLTGEDRYSYDTVEKSMKLTITTADGTSVTNGMLKAGTEYYAKRIIPASQQGIVPWKLEVYSAGNHYLRSSAIDYAAIRRSGDYKQINVLQMNVVERMNDDSYVGYTFNSSKKFDSIFASFTKEYVDIGKGVYDSDTNYPDKSKSMSQMMRSNQIKTANKFSTYLTPVNEFKVNIQYLFNMDWYTMFHNSPNNAVNLQNWESFLAQYDMLVFGFQDWVHFTSDPILVAGIQDFIDQGKSVIFSHDMVADPIVQYSDYTSWLRTVSGQRRAYYNLSNGRYIKSYKTAQLAGASIDLVPSTLATKDKHENKQSTIGTTTIKDPISKEGASEYGDNASVVLTRTFDNYKQYLINKIKNKVTLKIDRNTQELSNNNQDTILGFAGGTGLNFRDTSYVSMTNNGQITNYPYKIGSMIEVLQTHTQYYQLDLEFQDTGDATVWFNLTDMHSTRYKDEIQKIETANGSVGTNSNDTDLYSTRENDSRNNFYIYTKGNVTYTGLGHDYGKKYNTDALLTDDEIKLFVNTMISAYRQPESSPYASVTNADATGKDGTSVIYVDYDDSDSSQLVDGNVGSDQVIPVNFKLYDITINTSASKKYFVYFKDEAGNTIDGDKIDLYDESGNKLTAQGSMFSVSASEAGNGYTLKVPYSSLSKEGSVTYQICSYAQFEKNKKTVNTSISQTTAVIRYLPLFNLD